MFRITSVQDALAAIERIKSEGEGVAGSPEQPPNPGQLADYYMFRQIFLGNVLVFDAAAGKLVCAPGQLIQWPSISSFQASTATPDPSAAFDGILSQMLTHLDECWTKGADVQVAVNDMDALKDEGLNLIGRGARPRFACRPAPQLRTSGRILAKLLSNIVTATNYGGEHCDIKIPRIFISTLESICHAVVDI